MDGEHNQFRYGKNLFTCVPNFATKWEIYLINNANGQLS